MGQPNTFFIMHPYNMVKDHRSGYQTAVLSRLVKKVYTIERFGQLSESAQAVLGRLGIDNVEFCVDDGSRGW